MKVLLICNYKPGVGGISGQVELLQKHLREEGHTADIFTTKTSFLRRLMLPLKLQHQNILSSSFDVATEITTQSEAIRCAAHPLLFWLGFFACRCRYCHRSQTWQTYCCNIPWWGRGGVFRQASQSGTTLPYAY